MIAVGTPVRFKWVTDRGEMRGTVVLIRGQTLFVRLSGDRWRNLPPVPARVDELEPTTAEPPPPPPRPRTRRVRR